MKYTTPVYENNLFESKDVITLSNVTVTETEEKVSGVTEAENILGM